MTLDADPHFSLNLNVDLIDKGSSDLVNKRSVDLVIEDDLIKEGNGDLINPRAPFTECPISSPMVVDTVRISSPVPMLHPSAPSRQGPGAPSRQSTGCSFSTFGYGPNGKLEPQLQAQPQAQPQNQTQTQPQLQTQPQAQPQTQTPSQPGSKNIQEMAPQTEIDSQSTSSSETPSTQSTQSIHRGTHPTRISKLHKNQMSCSQTGAVPDICCHDVTMNRGTHQHRRRRRAGSNGSDVTSMTSYSETDDSGSHTSVEKDIISRNRLRTPDLLSPFHSRMNSNTSSGVSSVSQDSVSSVAKVQQPQSRLVSKLITNFQNSSLDETTPPGMGHKPNISQISKLGQDGGHIPKVGHSNWYSPGSTASSGITSSISDSFSTSDVESPDVGQVKAISRSHQSAPLHSMDRGGKLSSQDQESDLTSQQNDLGREYSSSPAVIREYNSNTPGANAVTQIREYNSCSPGVKEYSSITTGRKEYISIANSVVKEYSSSTGKERKYNSCSPGVKEYSFNTTGKKEYNSCSQAMKEYNSCRIGVEEYSSSTGKEMEYSSRESTSQVSDLSSLGYTPPGGTTHHSTLHQMELKSQRKNVSFQNSGRNFTSLSFLENVLFLLAKPLVLVISVSKTLWSFWWQKFRTLLKGGHKTDCLVIGHIYEPILVPNNRFC